MRAALVGFVARLRPERQYLAWCREQRVPWHGHDHNYGARGTDEHPLSAGLFSHGRLFGGIRIRPLTVDPSIVDIRAMTEIVEEESSMITFAVLLIVRLRLRLRIDYGRLVFLRRGRAWRPSGVRAGVLRLGMSPTMMVHAVGLANGNGRLALPKKPHGANLSVQSPNHPGDAG